MIAPIAPGPVYDPANEAQYRRGVQNAIERAMTPDRAANQLLLSDQSDGKVYSLVVISGVLTVTAV